MHIDAVNTSDVKIYLEFSLKIVPQKTWQSSRIYVCIILVQVLINFPGDDRVTARISHILKENNFEQDKKINYNLGFHETDIYVIKCSYLRIIVLFLRRLSVIYKNTLKKWAHNQWKISFS